MRSIKKTILKKAEEKSRVIFPEPSKLVIKERHSLLTVLCGLITITNNNSFVNIENDMHQFPVLQNIDFRFFTDNPNGRYQLARGLYDINEIEARLITDGIKNKTTMHSFGHNNLLNPLNPNSEIRMTDSTLEEIEIEHATFVIEQYLVGGRIEFLRFISEISDREELRKIANYILYQESMRDINVFALQRKK